MAERSLLVCRLFLLAVRLLSCISPDGSLKLLTPIDPAFLLLPLLRAVYPVRIYRSYTIEYTADRPYCFYLEWSNRKLPTS